MVVRSRLSEQSAASLARVLARTGDDHDRAPSHEQDAPPIVAAAAPRGGRWVWPYVALLLGGLVAVAGLSPTHAVSAHPGLLILLVGCVVVLDLIRIDVFERINISPASVP